MKDCISMNNYFSGLKSNDSREDREDDRKKETQIEIVTGQDAVSIEIIKLVKESIHCYSEYAKTVEHEHTERKRIIANLKALKYQIDAQKELYLKALEMYYEERKMLFDVLKESIRKATENGDKETLTISGYLLIDLYKINSGNPISLGLNSMINNRLK